MASLGPQYLYKPYDNNLYIGIIIFPYKHNTPSTGKQ